MTKIKVSQPQLSVFCVFSREAFPDHASSYSIDSLFPRLSPFPPALGIPLQHRFWYFVISHPLQISKLFQWTFAYFEDFLLYIHNFCKFSGSWFAPFYIFSLPSTNTHTHSQKQRERERYAFGALGSNGGIVNGWTFKSLKWIIGGWWPGIGQHGKGP